MENKGKICMASFVPWALPSPLASQIAFRALLVVPEAGLLGEGQH